MNPTPKQKATNILIIDDHPADVDLICKTLQSKETNVNIYPAGNSLGILALSPPQNQRRDIPHPDLILLELNMNAMDGREILSEFQKNDRLSRIPLIVLTSSQKEKDILAAYQLNANCYIVKPSNQKQFIEVIESIKDFWLTHVKLL